MRLVVDARKTRKEADICIDNDKFKQEYERYLNLINDIDCTEL